MGIGLSDGLVGCWWMEEKGEDCWDRSSVFLFVVYTFSWLLEYQEMFKESDY